MLLIAGGYEGGLVGLNVDEDCDSSASSTTSTAPSEPSFAFRFICSQGSIRCLALGSDFLCCGGSDETVQVYGLRHRKKHGDLLLSAGCITALGARGSIANGLLLVGDEHGSLQVFDVLKLSLKKQLKGHKSAVTAISVHPNGELALSVSEDATLRLWDLNTCLCVFFSRLNEPAIGVQWHPGGEDYFILFESQLLKLSLSEGAKPSVHKANNTKYCCASWIGDSIAVGCRSGAVVIYRPGEESGTDFGGVHSKRIKAITSLSGRVVTADSDGTILCSAVVSDYSEAPKLVEAWRFNVEMRVNCLTCSTAVE